MSKTKKEFIDFIINHNALKFGDFTLKSGRKSPYFFNLGVFHTGEALTVLASFYAKTLEENNVNYDLLFGPAYKGIPLATATSMVLHQQFNKNVDYCFNRKEIKSHGDKGAFVGAPLAGNVVMLDDVITAGTTVRETINLFQDTSATLSGIVIAFDRQEIGVNNHRSAVQETIEKHGIPIYSIISLTDIIAYLKNQENRKQEYAAISKYQAQFGTTPLST